MGRNEPSDAELLAGFRAGQEQVLAILFGRYEEPLRQFLLGLLRDHHQAEDALQETFVRALERLDTVDPKHVRGWLFTVAYHQAMFVRRRQKQRERLGRDRRRCIPAALTDPFPDPHRLAERKEDACRLQALLDRLPSGQREVICQRVFEGKRFREIAAALDCPLSTALGRMHEGLKRLRKWWAEQECLWPISDYQFPDRLR